MRRLSLRLIFLMWDNFWHESFYIVVPILKLRCHITAKGRWILFRGYIGRSWYSVLSLSLTFGMFILLKDVGQMLKTHFTIFFSSKILVHCHMLSFNTKTLGFDGCGEGCEVHFELQKHGWRVWLHSWWRVPRRAKYVITLCWNFFIDFTFWKVLWKSNFCVCIG